MELASDDLEFEPSMGKSGRGRGSSLAQLRASVSVTGRFAKPRAHIGKVAPTGLRAHFAKGSRRGTAPAFSAQRRVVVKARYVAHGAGRAAPLQAHVSYLAREAKGRRLQKEPAVAEA